MAFGQTSVASDSTQEFSSKLYEGLTLINVVATNPSKEELTKIFGREQTREPQYLFENNGVKSALISFLVKDVNDKVKSLNTVSFFIRDEVDYNRDKTKVRVIDKYGRTTWLEVEEAKKGTVPTYVTKGGVTLDRVSAGYRPAYKGESEVVDFIKTYLGIGNVVKFEDRQPVGLVDDPSKCECCLEHIKDYFKGDFSEVKGAINLEPNAVVQAVYYASPNGESGKVYQKILPKVIRPKASLENLQKWIVERQQFGAYAGLEFCFEPIKEYVETPTTFEENKDSKLEDLPW